MEFLENDLEEIMFNSSINQLNEKGLYLYGIPKRQLRIGSYGIADLVYFTREFNGCTGDPQVKINVVELKKDKIGISAFLQALRYVKGISRYLEKRNVSFEYIFEITLIGRTLDMNSSYSFLTDFIESNEHGYISNISNFTYSYSIDGLVFNHEKGYKLTTEGF